MLDTLPDAVAAARALVLPDRPVVLGICGAPGAGKTTLAEALVGALAAEPPAGIGPDRAVHVPMDGFHLADAELLRLGRLGRKGAPDTFDADGYAALLRRLVDPDRSRTAYAPAFERTLEQPLAGAIPIEPACRIVVTEGNYLLLDDEVWAPVRAALDEVWFVVVDDAIRRERLVRRHIRFGKTPDAAWAWVREVDEPNARRVAAAAMRADRVVAAAAAASHPVR
ncbi:nucleoside/nucleotide kinase family protein [Tsukamurella sp. 8F]|uniref:nucleoside/nucleotide kinase family protein n=1 Tax=unclassified Tsukamurella TaxID=2633480 RepID=UPI0023B98B37|nr:MULTISPECIES: nucleoside/nucleotide kinase family protein [unclassified Tsukamurella]MDF0528572.1 nucleoside/nucleotide kinase family protein [Tsukamurella sp. 8J]MDF0585534.1 nucleoside/nucleotide kinase family protein [Tsukamurella sp. 8F]